MHFEDFVKLIPILYNVLKLKGKRRNDATLVCKLRRLTPPISLNFTYKVFAWKTRQWYGSFIEKWKPGDASFLLNQC